MGWDKETTIFRRVQSFATITIITSIIESIGREVNSDLKASPHLEMSPGGDPVLLDTSALRGSCE